MILIGALGIVEIVGLDLLLSGAVVRSLAFFLGVVAAVVLIGFVVALVAFPHQLDLEKRLFALRYGATFELAIPLTCVEELRPHQDRRVQRKTAEAHDGVLRIPVAGETNLALMLKEPVDVALPKSDYIPIRQIDVYALDPRGAVDAVRDVLGNDETKSRGR